MRPSGLHGGHAATEFALVLPLFLALSFGVIDWSWTHFAQHTLVSRAARAARWAATRAFDQSTVDGATNMVLYGASACAGCESFLGLTAGNVAVEQTTSTATVANGVGASTITLQVRVSGYKVPHFAPLNQAYLSGRTIVAAHVWECVDSARSVQ